MNNEGYWEIHLKNGDIIKEEKNNIVKKGKKLFEFRESENEYLTYIVPIKEVHLLKWIWL